MGKDELLVIDRTYELVKWYLGRLERFPRSHRYGLGQRIETRLYAIFEGLGRISSGPVHDDEGERELDPANTSPSG